MKCTNPKPLAAALVAGFSAGAFAQQSAEESANTLPAITVRGTQDVGYTAPRASTATKTDLPLIVTPASVQVVPREVMDDQKAARLSDALENVSGLRPNPSLQAGTRFLLRGFANGGKIYRNGLLTTSPSGFRNEIDTAAIENVEVLKGPASVLFGRIEPGGLLNIVTKRPQAAPAYSIEQRIGSESFYRTEWDATGPIDRDASLSYRFAGAYQDSDSFRDFVSTRRVIAAPSITWRPSAATQFTVDAEYLDQEYFADFGIPAVGNRPASVPISRNLDDPNNPKDSMSRFSVGTDLSHQFHDSWTIRHRALYSNLTTADDFANPSPAFGTTALRADGRTLDRNIFGQESRADVFSTNLDLLGQFQHGRTRHEVLIGVDYINASTDYYTFGNFTTPDPALTIDIFNPVYGIDPARFAAARSFNPIASGLNFSVFKDRDLGIYLQDHITMFDKLHVVVGGRYDWAEVARGRGRSFGTATAALPAATRKDRAFTPRLGVLYQLVDPLSVYASYSESFGANNGLSATGATFDPEEGKQYEAGIKAELFDKRLNATLALFHLTKQNVLTADLSTPDPADRIAIGEQRSQGVEFDVTGRVTDRLSVIGSYAYTDAEVTRDDSGSQGKRFANVPRHAGSLWLKYDFQGHASADGLSVGAGVFAVGQRQGDLANTFQLPGYARFDATASYRWKVGGSDLTAQLLVRNLFDKTYYESADQNSNVAPRYGIMPGAPRTLIASLRLAF